jgi:hypothetical protein
LLKLAGISIYCRIDFLKEMWWTESTCLWTMWGVVHGGPATMADTELHRSSAMGRSRRRGTTPIAWEGGGEAGDAH